MSVGHLVEHDHKISGRDNCMEILCRRIDKHDHVSRSSSMEVVVLSAVYASQRREWKEAFQSLSDPTQRAVDTDGGLDAELQEASVEAQEEAGRRAEQVRLMNATLGQARSLQAASPCTSIDSDKIFENTRSIGSSVISQENIPVDNNARACHPAATVPAPSASSAGGALKPGAAEELVISFDRVLDLDSMLGEEPEVDDYSPQPTVVVDTGQVQLLAISELPLRSPVDSSPTHERQAPLTASFGEIGDSPSSADAQAISLRPSSKLSPDSGGRQEYRRESNSGMIVSSSNVVSKMETRKRHGVVNDEKLGYLFKRGRIRSMSFLKPWSYRWCTLNVANGLLSYHIEENG